MIGGVHKSCAQGLMGGGLFGLYIMCKMFNNGIEWVNFDGVLNRTAMRPHYILVLSRWTVANVRA